MTDLFSWNGWGLSVSESAGATIVLGQRPDKDSPEIVYGETALPFANENRPEPSGRSERIRQMRRLFVYGRESAEARAENFYRQAKYMEDYEDDAPWSGSFTAYYPTYQDLTVSQLRGYFSWRTKARRGEFSPIPTSAAYLYIYELFNGIGAASPKETLEKLREFEEGFLDAGLGDARMQTNVRRWMFEYAVLQDLPPVEVLKYADPAQTEMDNALAALSGAEDDEKIVRALFLFGGKKYEKSPAFADERGKQLLAEIWRKTIKDFAPGGKPCFEACFGRQIFFRWEPLSNAIYHYETQPYAAERIYILNKCRSFLCRGGVWQMYAYDKVFFHLHFVKELLHAADARLRRYLGTGKNLTEKPEEAWAQPYISAVLEEDRKGREEAAKPKIRIDLSGLERIRKDALVTQSSLLVEEEPAPELLAEVKPARKATEEGRFSEQDLGKRASEEVRFLGQDLGKRASETRSFSEKDLGKQASEARSFSEQEIGKRASEAGSFSEQEIGKRASEAGSFSEQEIGKRASEDGSSLEQGLGSQALEDGGSWGLDTAKGSAASNLLDALQTKILHALLHGEPVDGILRENHLMPSLVADEINECLYDEIGDNILECEDDRLGIVEDYIEELRELLEA